MVGQCDKVVRLAGLKKCVLSVELDQFGRVFAAVQDHVEVASVATLLHAFGRITQH